MNNKTILITGAAGFIGSYISNYLTKYYNLILVDSLEFGGSRENLHEDLRGQLIVENCNNKKKMQDLISEFHYCIHLAGISSLPENEINYSRALENNFMSTVNIYELCVQRGCELFLFASTSALYENNKTFPFKEVDEVSPDLMYSYSKNISENYLNFRSKKIDSIKTYSLRFFNVFGPNQNKHRKNPPLTAYLINCIESNCKAILYNNFPKLKRDYIFVEDILNFIYKILNTDIKNLNSIETINITSGNSYSVLDIVNLVQKVYDKELEYEFSVPKNLWEKYEGITKRIPKERITKEVRKESYGSNHKLLSILGDDYTFTDMKDGLRRIKSIQLGKK